MLQLSLSEDIGAHGDVVQRQETTRLGRVQCGFESLHPHHVDMVEQQTRCVQSAVLLERAGANPVIDTIYALLAQRQRHDP